MVLIEEPVFDFSSWIQKTNEISLQKEVFRLELFKKITARLSENAAQFPVSSIYIFGSILRKDHFNEYSDIDIAIDGLTDEKSFFKIWNHFEDLLEFKIDLVEMEKCSFADSIKLEGLKIK